MGRRPDPRTENTKMRIKKALLEYLCDSPFERITVKNICDSAGIDRSTFYTHYRNLSATLDEIIDEALEEEPSRKPYHCTLTDGQYNCPYGICDKVREHPEYGAAFFNESLTKKIIDRISSYSEAKYVASLTHQCDLSPEQARTLFLFQLNGCLAINRAAYRKGEKDWEETRDLVGGFIQGGLGRYKK